MRVIIAGGRDFSDYMKLKETVLRLLQNKIKDGIIVVCGEARGADLLGKTLAVEMGWAVDSYPAKWDEYGKRAGYLRNKEMAENADALIAFWNGESRGTKHMIDLAKKKNNGLAVRVVMYERNTK